METKPRILYLQKILLERTDEENPLSTTQLINILNDEYGISAHRTTVTKDIAALQEFGMDIVTIHSTQSKYLSLIHIFLDKEGEKNEASRTMQAACEIGLSNVTEGNSKDNCGLRMAVSYTHLDVYKRQLL